MRFLDGFLEFYANRKPSWRDGIPRAGDVGSLALGEKALKCDSVFEWQPLPPFEFLARLDLWIER